VKVAAIMLPAIPKTPEAPNAGGKLDRAGFSSWIILTERLHV
jgi:hypothetical protein